MKRVLAIVLLICTVLPLCACPGQTGTGSNKNEGSGSEAVWQDNLGEMDFGGEEVVVSVMDLYEYELFGEED